MFVLPCSLFLLKSTLLNIILCCILALLGVYMGPEWGSASPPFPPAFRDSHTGNRASLPRIPPPLTITAAESKKTKKGFYLSSQPYSGCNNPFRLLIFFCKPVLEAHGAWLCFKPLQTLRGPVKTEALGTGWSQRSLTSMSLWRESIF